MTQNNGPESREDSLTRLVLDLNVEKKLFKTIINCMADGVMLTDKNLIVTHHNPALMRLLGRPREVKAPFFGHKDHRSCSFD